MHNRSSLLVQSVGQTSPEAECHRKFLTLPTIDSTRSPLATLLYELDHSIQQHGSLAKTPPLVVDLLDLLYL